MDKRISDLKIDFTTVVDLKNENIKIFETMEGKITQLKNIYTEFIKNNKQQMFIFGLDSFHFQGKLIDIEYEDMKRLYAAITNRIYCEYFKLYKIVVDYILENIKDDKKTLDLISVNINSYPVYKDLEPFKKYEFDIIQNLHETIIILLNSVNNFLQLKENDLKVHQIKNATGLNIDNFIHTFNYNNVVLREKLVLFITYTEFFHKLHTKYFKRFTTKMQLFMSQINHDIKFEDSAEINKTKRRSMIETLEADSVNKYVLQELKQSIANENAQTPTSSLSSGSLGLEPINSAIQTNFKRETTTLQGIFLEIDEEQKEEQKEEPKEEPKEEQKEEQDVEQNDEQKPENLPDDMSLLTTESEPKQDDSIVTEQKPKRKYKPRKKKGDP